MGDDRKSTKTEGSKEKTPSQKTYLMKRKPLKEKKGLKKACRFSKEPVVSRPGLE